MRRLLLSFTVLVAAAATSGCASPSAASLISVDDVSADRALPDPAAVTVETGAEVRWRNIGDGAHTITLGRGADAILSSDQPEWGPERLSPGETLSRVFDEPGEYVYWFDDERTAGTITVEEPS
ncbi:hypothetical protein ELQ92_01710 [Labedella populi]|uniref:EfeO-type cupredoxin-like domain-containing protein n=1 Tax=Labedella populi TaxID=2498850 RepID=A0A444QEN6_9MICO|nr:hypothetical protein [Labedella populi]RWZ68000.1 hypothetical protein ELQ92_01710 [Labedella populi]